MTARGPGRERTSLRRRAGVATALLSLGVAAALLNGLGPLLTIGCSILWVGAGAVGHRALEEVSDPQHRHWRRSAAVALPAIAIFIGLCAAATHVLFGYGPDLAGAVVLGLALSALQLWQARRTRHEAMFGQGKDGRPRDQWPLTDRPERPWHS